MDSKKLIGTIIGVIAFVALIASATYAYWSWSSNESQKTVVNFTVNPGMEASIDGGTLSVSKLAPIINSSCATSPYATKAMMTLHYSNNSGLAAQVLGTLTVTTFTVQSGRNAFQTGDLAHLHYALTTSSSSCSSDVITSGTFDGKGSNGSVLFSDAVLKDNIATGTTNGSRTMYLYIWLDSGYSFQNVGSGAIQDPMEDLTIVLNWSGSISNVPTTP